MKNTTIKIAMLVLVATFVIPLGMISSQATNVSGATTIQLERVVQPISADLEQLNKLQILKEHAENQEERDAIQAQQDAIMKKTPRTEEQINEEILGNQKANLLTDSIVSKRGEYVIGEENYIPFTTIGYYPNEHALKIGIHEDFVNQMNMEKYANEIRSMVGSDIDIIVHNGGQYSKSDTCSTRTSDCTPMQGGIQIQVENHGGCTLGFPASRTVSSTTYDGFVTSGHCAYDETNSDVGQATISRVIGTVQIETYDYGSSSEYCDCAFIEIDSGSIALDQEIYGVSSSYYPDHVASASVDDYVKQSGKTSGVTIGQVIATSVSDQNDHGTILKDLVHANYSRGSGDSGAPVMDAYSADPGFLGTHAQGRDNSYPNLDDAYYVKYSNFETYLGGSLSWNLAP